MCSDQGQGPGQGGRRGEGKGGGPASVHHRLPQSDYAFLRTGGSQRPTPPQGKQPRRGILWCAMLVGLGNESHVAGACPCCVVGWEGGGSRRASAASHSRPTMHHTPYVNGDRKLKAAYFARAEQPSPCLPSPPLAPGTPRLLTGAVGTVGFSPPPPHPDKIPVSLWNAGIAAGGRCRLTSNKPPAWADLRCSACGVAELRDNDSSTTSAAAAAAAAAAVL